MKVVKWLDQHFEEAILVFLLVVIACVELAQVVCRNVPFLPALTWAEELCRFAWIATVFLSLPYTIRTSNILRVSVLIDALPWRLHNILDLFVDLVTAAMMGILAYNSIAVLQRTITAGETSPAMVWPMWIMYAIVLIGFALATLRSIEMFVIHVMHINDAPPTLIEEKMKDEVAQEWVVPAVVGTEAQAEYPNKLDGFGPRDEETQKGGDE